MCVAIAVLTSGCPTFAAYSPPSQFASLNTPGALQPAAVAVSVGGSFGTSSSLFVVGSSTDLTYVHARVRVGLVERLEVAAELAASGQDSTFFGESAPCADGTSGSCDLPSQRLELWTFHSRAAVKYEIAPRILAATLGVGGGTSRLGGFFALDVGLTLGYENDVLVPFMTWSPGVSLPIGARSLTVAGVSDAPRTTRTQQIVLGLKLPIGPHVSANQRQVNFMLAYVYNDLSDSDSSIGFSSLAMALEVIAP